LYIIDCLGLRQVFMNENSNFLEKGKKVEFVIEDGRGLYLYVLEGGSVEVNSMHVPVLGAAKITEEKELHIEAEDDAELLLVDVLLI